MRLIPLLLLFISINSFGQWKSFTLTPAALQTFVDGVLERMIFDGEALSDLMAPLELGWKARAQAETALMTELVPLLNKRAQGRDISGLSAYEQ